MKRLEGQIAEVMKEIIDDGDYIVEIDGRKYYLSVLEEAETSVAEDVKNDLELQQKLFQAKKIY